MSKFRIGFIFPIIFLVACASTSVNRTVAEQGDFELVYRLDMETMKKIDKDADENSIDICGYPNVFKMESDDPIGPTFIEKIIPKSKAKRIQATEASTGGGRLPKIYQGEYREKVYIVRQVIKGIYQPGIYTRVQVTTYGDTDAPSGLVVNSRLLNHRYSAELAEGDDCGDIYYKLVR